MKELGVITIEHRIDENKGYQSNLYTLYDYAEIWSVDTGSSEEVVAVVNEYEEIRLISELRSRGYIVTKEKEPETTVPTKVTVDSSTQVNQYDIVNITTSSGESQDLERYTLDQIKQLFEYDIDLQACR